MNRVLLFAGITMLIIAQDLNGQWIQSGLASKKVTTFLVNGANFFAGTSDSLFLSTNTGASWSRASAGVSPQNIHCLAIKGANLLAGADTLPGIGISGIFLSTNSGASWSVTSLPRKSVNALLADGLNVFAGTFGALAFKTYVSTDDGATWNVTGGQPASVSSVTALIRSDTNLIAGSESGSFISTQGASWSLGNANTYVTSFAGIGSNVFMGSIAFFSGSGVYRSTNHGSTWTELNSGLTDTSVYALAASSTNLFAGTASGVFLSSNNGASWTAVNTGLTTPINALTVNGTMLFAGTDGGVWRRPLTQMITSVQGNTLQLPTQISLEQNYPNPFNRTTQIDYELPQRSFVTLKIYDVLGKEIATLVNSSREPGPYTTNWNAQNYPSGVYFYRLTAGSYTMTKKLVLMK